MKTFDYTITHPFGIHARPAGMLVKEAKQFSAVCTITKGEVTRKLTQLMMLMAMGVKQGDRVTICAQGEDEEIAIQSLQKLFEENL